MIGSPTVSIAATRAAIDAADLLPMLTTMMLMMTILTIFLHTSVVDLVSRGDEKSDADNDAHKMPASFETSPKGKQSAPKQAA